MNSQALKIQKLDSLIEKWINAKELGIIIKFFVVYQEFPQKVSFLRLFK